MWTTRRVGVQRAHLLRLARALHALHEESRHLLQLLVLATTEVLRVDDDALVAAEVAPIRGVDNVLKRIEALALATQQHFTVLAKQLHANAAVLEVLEIDVHRQPHCVYQVLDKGPQRSVQLFSHDRVLRRPRGYACAASIFVGFRSAGRRGPDCGGPPSRRLVSTCWPIVQRLLTSQ